MFTTLRVLYNFVYNACVESFPPAPTWTEADMGDLSGKVFLVTGGNSGIGLEVCKVLLKHGGRAARNEEKAVAAIEEIKSSTGLQPIFLHLDLADLDSVQRAAKTFMEKETRLDVLYNSAGVMIPPLALTSAQNYDLTFASNVLGHFYLTTLLRPLLTPKSRIIWVSSGAHHLHSIDYATLRDGPARRAMSPEMLYAQSKFATVVLARECARRWDVVSIGMNPGNVKTPLQREINAKWAINWMLHPIVPNGIVTHLWAGTAEETAEFNGKYAIPFARLGTPRRETQDPEVGRALWEWLEAQVAGRDNL